MNHFYDWVKTALDVFIAVGGGLGLSRFLKASAATQKNEHIKTALTFASQAVLQAQAFLGGGQVQQDSAAASLKERLDTTGLGKHFTEQQILNYIQEAYAKAKADGSLDKVKPLVSEDDLKAAEAVVANTPEKFSE